MTKETLGDRMKLYEEDARFLPLLPIVARIDGKCFSKFTKGLTKPYDIQLVRLMQETTRYLVQETNACIGYTQSDEITLVLYSPSFKSQIFMDGRKAKILSVLASMTTAFFNAKLPDYIPSKGGTIALFDARANELPTKGEVVNNLMWRELDATRNSISSAARAFFSHKEVNKKNGNELMDMLFQKGVNWNDYPAFFKRGTYIQRREVIRKFTETEISKLPPKHAARNDPSLVYTRHDVAMLEMPSIAKIVNREDVIFEGAAPVTNEGVIHRPGSTNFAYA